MFLVEMKKYFASVMGRTYNGGKELSKTEKKEKEGKEIELKKQKLEKMVKQEKEKEEQAKPDVNVPGDEDMPLLISNDDDIGDKEGTEKKFTFKKPPLWKCHNDIGDKEGTEKKLTTKKPPLWKPPHK